jgi:dihydroorotate dehydrogenase electron transfer subunit
LLVGAGAGVAPLAALADQALARDANVTLLADAGGIPPEMLPPQVEYVATAESPPLADLVAWADQIAVALPSEALPALARGIAGTSKPVQVALGGWLGCGTGICQACVVRTRRGPRRICRDGPVFDLAELA